MSEILNKKALVEVVAEKLEMTKKANVLHVWESTLPLRNLLKSPLQRRQNSKLQKH